MLSIIGVSYDILPNQRWIKVFFIYHCTHLLTIFQAKVYIPLWHSKCSSDSHINKDEVITLLEDIPGFREIVSVHW